MTSPRAHEVLYESEAALRLVDAELLELRNPAPTPVHQQAIVDLPAILDRANAQIHDVLIRLRSSRAALQTSAIGKLHSTHDKIREVTSATEDAAINIMDACDRAASMLDELDSLDALPERDVARGAQLRATLRDELFLMMGALQFQDITTQQLDHASSVLVEMDARLVDVARLLDSNAEIDSATTPQTNEHRDLAYDPNATVRNAEHRQSLADEIFTGVRSPAV